MLSHTLMRSCSCRTFCAHESARMRALEARVRSMMVYLAREDTIRVDLVLSYRSSVSVCTKTSLIWSPDLDGALQILSPFGPLAGFAAGHWPRCRRPGLRPPRRAPRAPAPPLNPRKRPDGLPSVGRIKSPFSSARGHALSLPGRSRPIIRRLYACHSHRKPLRTSAH